jgi:hypothetical protein
LRPISDHAERYEAVSKHLEKAQFAYGTRFHFLEEGIRIGAAWYPVVKMEWVEGQLLHRYIEDNLNEPPVLAALRTCWRALVHELEAAKIAHGDLQHGNIVARGRELLLIDYDGMWVPALDGRAATELGHRAYQHPKRRESDFGSYLDCVASLVIDVSIGALALNAGLWEQYHTGDNLLFVRDDFVDAGRSGIWQSLAELDSPEIDALCAALVASFAGNVADAPSLAAIVKKAKKAKRKPARRAAPQQPEVVAGLPAWLAAGAPAALPILDQAKEWKFVWRRPDERREMRWQERPSAAPVAERVPVAALAAVPAAARTAPGVLGRMTAMLKRGIRALEIDPETEPQNDPEIDRQFGPQIDADAGIEPQIDPEIDRERDVARVRAEVRVTAPGMRAAVAAMQASPEGARLVVVAKNGECGFWNVGADAFTATPNRIAVVDLAAFATGVPVAVVASANEACVWDLTRWVRTQCPTDRSNTIRSVALSADASRVAIGYENARVVIIDVAAQRVAGELQLQASPVTALAFADDGRRLVAATSAGSVHLWRFGTDIEPQGDGYIHTARVRHVAFAAGGQQFASADDHGLVTIWTTDMQRVFSVPMCRLGVGSLCFVGERDLALGVGCNDGTVRVASVGAGRVVACFRLGAAPVTALSGANRRPGLAVGTGDGGVGLVALR